MIESLCVNQGKMCLGNISNVQGRVKFSYQKLNVAEELVLTSENGGHCIVFLLSGSIHLSFAKQATLLYQQVNQGELACYSTDEITRTFALIPSEVMVMEFDVNSDESAQRILFPLSVDHPGIMATHKKIVIKKCIWDFVTLVKIYLEEQIKSPELYAIKKQEFFTLLCAFYSKEELGNIFYCNKLAPIFFKTPAKATCGS